MYSADGTMHGFVNHTLSSFNVSDFQNGTAPDDPLDLGYEVQICRYCSPRPSGKNQFGGLLGKAPFKPGLFRGVSQDLSILRQEKK